MAGFSCFAVLLGTLAHFMYVSGQNFQECLQFCVEPQRCSPLALPLVWTGWDCEANCKYECMHQVTDARVKQGLPIQKFYGKWPFYRFLGMQEPAAVAFSLGNMFAHVYGLARYTRTIDRNYSLKPFWIAYGLVNINTWLWSAVFHTRDLRWTELLDYFSAFFTVLFTLCLSLYRVFHLRPPARLALGLLFALFFVGHVSYLLFIKFDYGWNMLVNVVFGVVYVLLWLSWSFYYRRPYARKVQLALALIIGSVLLELGDFPPLFGVFDAHALWHGATIVVAALWWQFLQADAEFELKKRYSL